MSKLLKSKILLGVMIVAVMVVGFTLVTPTASADCSLSMTLKQGMRNAEVSCLQAKLNVTPATGYFGTLTKAAVMAYQSNNMLTADGVVGAMTRAKLMSTPVVVVPNQGSCPAGYVAATPVAPTFAACVPATPVQGACPAGYVVIAPVAPTFATCAVGTVVIGTGEGTVTVEYAATPAATTSIKKGEANQSVATLKIKATGSDMKVSRLWLDVNARLWLYADNAALYDGATVLGSIPLSASAFSEVTTGSLWELQFNNLNVTVPVGTTKELTLKLSRPTLTNDPGAPVKITADSSIRVTDAAGFSETKNLTERTLSLSTASASTGTMTANLSASSPLDMSVAGLSTTLGTLTPVKLLDFDLKSKDSAMNITKIIGGVTGITNIGTVANEVAAVELRDGTNVLSSVALATGVATFADLNIDVAKDSTKTLSIWAQMNPIGTAGPGKTVKGTGIAANVTVSAAGIVTTDSLFGTITPTGAVQGKTMKMFEYAPTLALGTVSAVSVEGSAVGKKQGNYSIAFTVTAPSGSDIYVDTANLVLVDTGTGKTVAANGGTLVTTSSISGVDSKGSVSSYDKVAAGTSRTFTVSGTVPNGGLAGFTGMKILQVKWNDVDAVGGVTQTWGLSDFKTAEVYVTVA